MTSSTDLLASPVFTRRIRFQLATYFLRSFFMGFEYALIYSTLLLYMDTFTKNDAYAGLTVALHEVSGIIALPLTGYLYDKTKRPKELLLFLNCFQIIGNIVYSLSFSKWFLISGRFIRGFGDGFVVLVVSDVAYFYDSSKRVGILSIIESAQVLGMIAGSVITFYLDKQSTHLGSWVINRYTLPGIVMAIIWLLVQAQTLFCASNIVKESIANRNSTEETKSLLTSEENGVDGESPTDDENCSCFPRKISEGDEQPRNNTSKIDKIKSESTTCKTNVSYRKSISEIISFDFFVIFAVALILLYVNATYELVMPHIAELEYKWSPKIIGGSYIVGSLTVLLIFGAMYIFSDRCFCNDVYLLIVSMVLTFLSLVTLTLESIVRHHDIRVVMLCATSATFLFSLPFSIVCTKSLLTKMMRPDLQGILQGITIGISRVAMVAGPILYGIVVNHRMVYGIVTSIITLIILFAFISCLKRISERQREVLEQRCE